MKLFSLTLILSIVYFIRFKKVVTYSKLYFFFILLIVILISVDYRFVYIMDKILNFFEFKSSDQLFIILKKDNLYLYIVYFVVLSIYIFFIETYFKLFSDLTNLLNSKSLYKEKTDQLVHDIKSPLSAIQMTVKNLKNISDEEKNMIEKISMNINKMTDRIKDSDENKESYNIEIIELLSFVKDTVEEKKQEYKNQKLNFKLTFKSLIKSDMIYIKFDRVELKRILSNIINNSVESFENIHREEKEIILDICSRNEKNSLIIADNGKGISKKHIDDIFTKNKSFNKKDSNKGKRGLGLYHAKKIIEELEGEIIVESNEGVGTSIKLLFNRMENIDYFCENVLIDNDELIRLSWESKALEKQIILKTYNSFKSFFDEIDRFNKNINIFIDSSLDEDEPGEVLAKKIFEKGYKNIIITSSFDKERFKDLNYIKNIINKNPPW